VVGQRVYTIVELDESLLSGAVLRRVVELYGMLYLDKYSQSAFPSCETPIEDSPQSALTIF
jgi:hypothetical protein